MDIEDYELDKFFREKTFGTDQEPEFNEQAWKAMQRKLDRRDRRVMLVKIGVAVMLLLVSFFAVSIFLNQQDESGTKSKLAKKESKQPEPKGDPAAAQIKQANSGPKTLSNKDKEGQQWAIASRNFMNLPHKQKSDSGEELQEPVSTGVLQQNQELASAGLNENKNSRIITPEENLPDLKDSSGIIAMVQPPTNHVAADSAGAEKKSNRPKSKKSTGFSLAFSAGPEFNSAGSVSEAKGSMGMGISLNARRGKIGLSTGLNYSAKNYTASTAEYSTLSPKLKSTITYIDASCRVLEIPLKMTYQVAALKKGSLAVSGGLSSYFMLREKYRFEYSDYSGIPDYNLTLKNANQHLFKVASFSAIYQVPLKNSRNQLGIEPYIKVPLQGVGQGHIYLKSYGVNLNFSHGLFSGKK